MPEIPYAEAPELPDSPEIRTRMSGAAAAAPYKALAGIGTQVMQAGQVFKQYDMQTREADDYTSLKKLEIYRNQKKDDLMTEIQDRKVPLNKQAEYFQDGFKDFGTEMADGMSPKATERWSVDHEFWLSNENINMNTIVRKGKNRERRGIMESELRFNIKAGNLEGGIESIKGWARIGVLGGDEAIEKILELENGVALSQVDAGLSGDGTKFHNTNAGAPPKSGAHRMDKYGTLAALNEKFKNGRHKYFKDLSPDQRKSMVTRAETEINQSSIDMYDLFMDPQADKGQALELAEELLADGYMKQAHYNRLYSRLFKPAERKFNAGKFDNLMTRINAHVEGGDDVTKESESKIRGGIIDALLDDKSESLLWGRLNKITGGGGEESQSPSYRKGHQMLDQWYSSGLFGNIKPDEFSKELDPVTFMKAQKKRADMFTFLTKYEETNPDATMDDIYKVMSDYNQADRTALAHGKDTGEREATLRRVDPARAKERADADYEASQTLQTEQAALEKRMEAGDETVEYDPAADSYYTEGGDGEYEPLKQRIFNKYPRLAKYDFGIEKVDRKSPYGGSIEFLSEDETGTSEEPGNTTGKPLIRLYEDQSSDPEELEGAVMGDMLHNLARKDTHWRKLRSQFMAARSPEAKKFDRRKYEEAKASGEEKRSFEQWMDVTWADASIRGPIRGNQEWMEHLTPKQEALIEEMKRYLAAE